MASELLTMTEEHANEVGFRQDATWMTEKVAAALTSVADDAAKREREACLVAVSKVDGFGNKDAVYASGEAMARIRARGKAGGV